MAQPVVIFPALNYQGLFKTVVLYIKFCSGLIEKNEGGACYSSWSVPVPEIREME